MVRRISIRIAVIVLLSLWLVVTADLVFAAVEYNSDVPSGDGSRERVPGYLCVSHYKKAIFHEVARTFVRRSTSSIKICPLMSYLNCCLNAVS